MQEEIFWHTQSNDKTLKLLEASISGLSDVETSNRLLIYGENEIPHSRPDSLAGRFFRQFESPLVFILLISALIVIFMGNYLDGSIIALVLLINAVVGTIQEGRATATLEALRKFTKTQATVEREGQEIQIQDTDLVPGDIVILREGEKVPADCRILEQTNLEANESSITGESLPVEKHTEPISNPTIPLTEQKNMLFRGTLITRGGAKVVVTATGASTHIGEISEKVALTKHEIPLQTHLRELANILILVVLGFSILLFIIGVWQGASSMEMFSTVVALAVSVIPEGLPIAVTLVLASGVYRMSKRHALVKKLQAVEALGHIDIIAVDKTGTITKNELVAVRLIIGKSHYTFTGSGYDPTGKVFLDQQQVLVSEIPELNLAAKVFALSSNASIFRAIDTNNWSVAGDPIEAALLIAAGKLGALKDELLTKYAPVEELSFDYKRRFHATVHKRGKQYFLSAVGAPEAILELCPNVKKAQVLAKVKIQAAKGLRVLAYAYKEHAKPLLGNEHPNLVFGGLVCLEDQLQENITESVTKLQEAGIKVVMLTGDNPITARSIGEQAGIAKTATHILTSKDLLDANFNQKEFAKAEVFARVTPEDKLTIVERYGSLRKTIAMTGDGVNDAPALMAADLGMAMGKNGTEVAKEAADIVLLDDNFSNIVAAVEEGRSMYLTIKKVLIYLFSTSVGELLTVTIAVLLSLPLPVIATQIIWLNFVTDGFLTVALGMEPGEKSLLTEPYTKPIRYLLSKENIARILIMGGVMAGATLYLFTHIEGTLIYRQSMALTLLAVLQWLNAWNSRSEKSIFVSRPWRNPWLVLATLTVILLQFLALYWAPLQNILQTYAINAQDWTLVLLYSLSIVLADELYKLFRWAIKKLPRFL